MDLQDQDADDKGSKRNIPGHTSDVFTRNAPLPVETDLRHAAQVLNTGEKVVILAGRGALGAGDELEQLADMLAAPIVKALLGKAVVPDDSPLTTGPVGLLGTKPSQEALESCDTLLLVGTSFPYIEFLPRPGQARGVQIELDPARVGLRYPVEVGLIGDSKRTLQALIPLLERKRNRTFLEECQAEMRDWWRLMEEQGTSSDSPMKPQVVAWELGKRLRDDAIVIADSGTVATWWARQIPVKRGQIHTLSGTLATMANGVPYAVAAQIAYPNRQCVVFIGDGGFSMLLAEFVTCVKYGLPIKVVVANNSTLGMIKWEQMAFLGNPEYGCDLQPIDFAAFARACGATGYRIEKAGDCGRVLDEALAIPGPVVVDAIVDPHEPPLPPKVTLDQAKHFAQALLRGEPHRQEIALTAVSGMIRQLT